MQVHEYCLVWHVYTVPILGLCYIYKNPVKVIQIKRNTPLYIYILFLNWSCQSCCSRRNQQIATATGHLPPPPPQSILNGGEGITSFKDK